MKKYTSYSNIREPYFNFSELLGFPILPLCAIAFISFGILFFFGLTVMLASNGAIAVLLTYMYHGLKNGSPNGSRNATISVLSVMLSFLAILSVILITNTGAYIVYTFQQTGVFYDLYFYIWLFVLLALPVLYFILQELKYQFQLHYMAYNFTPLRLRIIHDYELITCAESFDFLNTKKELAAHISISERNGFEHIGKLKYMSVSERNECLYQPLFDETVHIPKGTNRLKISWYSIIEDMYYEDEMDFPFDNLQYVENKYPTDISKFLRGKKTERVTLSIRQGGKIHLFNKDQNIIDPVALKAAKIGDEDKQAFRDACERIYDVDGLLKNVDIIKRSDAIAIRAAITDYVCSWQVTGIGLQDHNIEIKDVQNNYTTGAPIALNTFEQRRLPIFFEIDYRKITWVNIHIDAEKLYSLLKKFGDTELAVTFDFELDPEKGYAELRVKNNDTVMAFTGWEKEVNEYRLKDVKETLLKNKDYTVKNNFLKEIYELILAQDYVRAEQLCKKALEQYPYFPMIYFYEARLLWYLKGFEASYAKQSYFLDKTKTDPYASAQVYNHYGCLYDEEKRYAESLPCFENAYASYPQQLFYLANIAEIHYKLKNSTKALQYANECIEKKFTSDMVAEIIANNGIRATV